jgi:prepilin-type N-terminal cleavage/methylation domain-containing protein
MAANRKRPLQAGFTLIEILIALAIGTALTLSMFAAITPWINYKHKIDTEHRMAELKDAVTTAYRNYAMQVDTQVSTAAVLAVGPDAATPITSSPPLINGTQTACGPNVQAAISLLPYLSNMSLGGIQDGYAQNICIYISMPLAPVNVEGTSIYYRVVALVSSGQDGRLDPGTGFNPTTGALTLGGDDVGVLVSGFPIEYALYKESKARLDRLADMYSSFFTSRFQGNYARDYSVDYFVGCATSSSTGTLVTLNNVTTCSQPYDYDSVAILPTGTASSWETVVATLAPALGLGPEEETSAWDLPATGSANANNFMVANQALGAADQTFGVQVQDPSVKSVNLPPYTALLRAQIPTPSDFAVSYVLKVVSGTY